MEREEKEPCNKNFMYLKSLKKTRYCKILHEELNFIVPYEDDFNIVINSHKGDERVSTKKDFVKENESTKKI